MCLWTYDIGGEEALCRHRILPDGCVDIVWIGESAPLVAGPATRPLTARLPVGTTIVGARFRPGRAADVLGVPVDELLDQHVPLADLWGASAGEFMEPVLQHPPGAARLRALSAAVQGRSRKFSAPDPVVLAAVSWLASHPAGLVRDLGRAIGMSPRHLQRRFRAAVGYGPKVFQRIVRLQRFLSLAGGRHDLAGTAGMVGYADQAHMCREIRDLSGVSPRDLLEQSVSTLEMSDLFNTVDTGRR
jgi:AraC-like DNA-binding protein